VNEKARRGFEGTIKNHDGRREGNSARERHECGEMVGPCGLTSRENHRNHKKSPVHTSCNQTSLKEKRERRALRPQGGENGQGVHNEQRRTLKTNSQK